MQNGSRQDSSPISTPINIGRILDITPSDDEPVIISEDEERREIAKETSVHPSILKIIKNNPGIILPLNTMFDNVDCYVALPSLKQLLFMQNAIMPPPPISDEDKDTMLEIEYDHDKIVIDDPLVEDIDDWCGEGLVMDTSLDASQDNIMVDSRCASDVIENNQSITDFRGNNERMKETQNFNESSVNTSPVSLVLDNSLNINKNIHLDQSVIDLDDESDLIEETLEWLGVSPSQTSINISEVISLNSILESNNHCFVKTTSEATIAKKPKEPSETNEPNTVPDNNDCMASPQLSWVECNLCKRRFMNKSLLTYHKEGVHNGRNQAVVLVNPLPIPLKYQNLKLRKATLKNKETEVVLEYDNIKKCVKLPSMIKNSGGETNIISGSFTNLTDNLSKVTTVLQGNKNQNSAAVRSGFKPISYIESNNLLDKPIVNPSLEHTLSNHVRVLNGVIEKYFTNTLAPSSSSVQPSSVPRPIEIPTPDPAPLPAAVNFPSMNSITPTKNQIISNFNVGQNIYKRSLEFPYQKCNKRQKTNSTVCKRKPPVAENIYKKLYVGPQQISRIRNSELYLTEKDGFNTNIIYTMIGNLLKSKPKFYNKLEQVVRVRDIPVQYVPRQSLSFDFNFVKHKPEPCQTSIIGPNVCWSKKRPIDKLEFQYTELKKVGHTELEDLPLIPILNFKSHKPPVTNILQTESNMSVCNTQSNPFLDTIRSDEDNRIMNVPYQSPGLGPIVPPMINILDIDSTLEKQPSRFAHVQNQCQSTLTSLTIAPNRPIETVMDSSNTTSNKICSRQLAINRSRAIGSNPGKSVILSPPQPVNTLRKDAKLVNLDKIKQTLETKLIPEKFVIQTTGIIENRTEVPTCHQKAYEHLDDWVIDLDNDDDAMENFYGVEQLPSVSNSSIDLPTEDNDKQIVETNMPEIDMNPQSITSTLLFDILNCKSDEVIPTTIQQMGTQNMDTTDMSITSNKAHENLNNLIIDLDDDEYESLSSVTQSSINVPINNNGTQIVTTDLAQNSLTHQGSTLVMDNQNNNTKNYYPVAMATDLNAVGSKSMSVTELYTRKTVPSIDLARVNNDKQIIDDRNSAAIGFITGHLNSRDKSIYISPVDSLQNNFETVQPGSLTQISSNFKSPKISNLSSKISILSPKTINNMFNVPQ